MEKEVKQADVTMAKLILAGIDKRTAEKVAEAVTTLLIEAEDKGFNDGLSFEGGLSGVKGK